MSVLNVALVSRENELIRRLRQFGVSVRRVLSDRGVIMMEIDAIHRHTLRNLLVGQRVCDIEGQRTIAYVTSLDDLHIVWNEGQADDA